LYGLDDEWILGPPSVLGDQLVVQSFVTATLQAVPGSVATDHELQPEVAMVGILAGSLRGAHAAKTLALDLGGHLVYGAGTGVTLWMLASALD
jgi:hypothetical protein